MKPVRDPAFLAFVRSLPCSICYRTRGVEAAHIGRRGMAQKSSDREAIPLCSLHHKEQHRIGMKRFAESYALDIPALVEQLNQRPYIFVKPVPLQWPWGVIIPEPHYFADYRDECFRLFPVCNGIAESIELAKELCREYLIETVFRPERERRRGPGDQRASKGAPK